LNQFFERIKNRLEWLDKLNSSGTISVLNEYLPIYIQKLEGMPFMIRWIVKLFLGRFDFLGIVSGVLNEQGQIDIGQKEIINKISDKVNTVLDEKLFSPSFTGIITLYIINISAFIIIKVIL
ncbi:MAG TPA: hypothetical protein PK079_17195, partial [Leptospiraceae bacterium]|nr:hypothetical protein [Leptospiraceae bacterium]